MTWLMRLIALNDEQSFVFGFLGKATNTECFRSVEIMPILYMILHRFVIIPTF